MRIPGAAGGRASPLGPNNHGCTIFVREATCKEMETAARTSPVGGAGRFCRLKT
jgi:hypothetical protein